MTVSGFLFIYLFIIIIIIIFFFVQMPVCQFFLRGTCSNDNCPYSHVNVSKKAEVCEDFLKGFCSRGQQVSTMSACRFSHSEGNFTYPREMGEIRP